MIIFSKKEHKCIYVNTDRGEFKLVMNGNDVDYVGRYDEGLGDFKTVYSEDRDYAELVNAMKGC